MTPPTSDLPAKSRWSTAQLDRVAWSIFFIWICFTMLVELPWGWFLLALKLKTIAIALALLMVSISPSFAHLFAFI